jgi:hypothetical protein
VATRPIGRGSGVASGETRVECGTRRGPEDEAAPPEAVILLSGIGFQPVIFPVFLTGWKPIPRFFHNLPAFTNVAAVQFVSPKTSRQMSASRASYSISSSRVLT